MNSGLLRKLMDQEFEMAKAKWERGELNYHFAGYHNGAINAYAIAIQTTGAAEHAHSLTTQILDMHFHPKAKEPA